MFHLQLPGKSPAPPSIPVTLLLEFHQALGQDHIFLTAWLSYL